MNYYARLIFNVTLISVFARFLSLAATQVYLGTFGGSSEEINIYSFALQLPNYAAAVFGAFIGVIVTPTYARLSKKDEGARFIGIMSFVTVISAFLLGGFIFFGAPFLTRIAGFKDFEFAVRAFRLFSFSLVLYGVIFIAQAILHGKDKFLIAAFSSAPFGLALIIYSLGFGERFGVNGLIYAALIGLGAQAIILIYGVLKTKAKINFNFFKKNNDNNGEIKKALLIALPPVALDALFFNFGAIFSSALAARLGVVAIALFAQRLMLVCVMAFIDSVTTTTLPSLARLWEEKQKKEYAQILQGALRAIIYLITPVGLGMFLLSREIIALLAQWGRFGADDAEIAAQILGIYGLGALFIGLKQVLDRGFYSQGRAKEPAIVGLIILLINVCFSLIFLDKLGFLIMPFAFMFSVFFGVIAQIFLLQKSVSVFNKQILKTLLKTLIACVLMAVFVNFIKFEAPFYFSEVLRRVLAVGIPALAGAAIYGVFAFGLNFIANKGVKL